MKAGKVISLSLGLAGSTVAFGQVTFSQIADNAVAEVKQAESELAELRSRIADEKIPISQQLTQLESEVETQRREYDRVVSAAENRDVDLNTLQDKVKAQQDENVYLRNTMGSYITGFETRIDESETQLYGEAIQQAQEIVELPEAGDSEKLEAQVSVIQTSIDRLKAIVGGQLFDGDALGTSDQQVSGKYALVGPFVFFGDGGENVGFAETTPNAAFPSLKVKGIDPKILAAIKDLTDDGEGQFPLDASMGDAFKLAETKETFVEHIVKGGSTMIFIIGLGIIAMIVAIFKFFEIISVKRPKPGTLQQILDNLNAGKKQQALEIANSVDGPFGDLLVAGVEHSDQEKELLEEVLYERLLAAQPKLERFLAFIALTAAASPLLGLLGTVTGMINTFKLITVFGTGDAASLSSGISVALITTEYGLIVAIPALLAQALLSRLAKGKLGEMEQASVAFVNGLHKHSSPRNS